jgi:hypothetical protein
MSACIKSVGSRAPCPPRGVTYTPNAFAQPRYWERVVPPALKLASRDAGRHKKRMDLPPNHHPRSGVASSNVPISSSTASSTLGDSPADYFAAGKPAVAGEERFRSLTDIERSEFEAMGFGGLESGEKKLQFGLTEGAWMVCGASNFLL